MRKVTMHVVNAFLRRQRASMGNTSTDGTSLYLHGNKIAEWRSDGLWVTDAGWSTRTTHDRLRAIVPVYTDRGTTFLDGQPWDGEWTRVKAA